MTVKIKIHNKPTIRGYVDKPTIKEAAKVAGCKPAEIISVVKE
jgi:hypothetical protein